MCLFDISWFVETHTCGQVLRVGKSNKNISIPANSDKLAQILPRNGKVMISWPDPDRTGSVAIRSGPCLTRLAQIKIKMPKNGRSLHGTARPGNPNGRSVSAALFHKNDGFCEEYMTTKTHHRKMYAAIECESVEISGLLQVRFEL